MASTSDLIVGADGHVLEDAEAIGKHPPGHILGLARGGRITVGMEGDEAKRAILGGNAARFFGLS
jgi:hypothetical protein